MKTTHLIFEVSLVFVTLFTSVVIDLDKELVILISTVVACSGFRILNIHKNSPEDLNFVNVMMILIMTFFIPFIAYMATVDMGSGGLKIIIVALSGLFAIDIATVAVKVFPDVLANILNQIPTVVGNWFKSFNKNNQN